MSIHKMHSESGILYVRANLKPFARVIRTAGGVKEFLADHFEHEELFAPYFMRARPFWERPQSVQRETNSGALGKKLAEYPGAVLSRHPSHRFVGFGARVGNVLKQHDHTTSCFYPIRELARRSDFSMLLLGCNDESPGFSTVHATQQALGLSQKHLFRYLIRWDIESEAGTYAMTATESPGCSLSFDIFYSEYQKNGNLIRGELLGQQYLYVQSASKALAVEEKILSSNPRFVNCGRMSCSTCRFRLY